MSDLIQVTIKDLLKQISDRANHGREERMQASLELCRTLERLRNLQELPKGWQELGDDFLVIITARSGPLELKKNLSTCLAALGVLTGWEYELFIQWLLDAIEALHRKAEEERMMLIGAMASSIVVNATKSFPFAEKLSDKLMKFAIKSLEANTSHQVHSSLMELCTAVSQFSPTKFRAFFEDMVDLTVGWLMDETVPKKIHAKCEEALLGLSSFWLERPNYAKELMKQFRRDIVEDLEDLRNGGITGKEAQTVLSRAGSLIKTHAIIMRIYLNAPNEENLRIVIVSTIEELILAGESYISIFRVNDSNPTKLFLALVYVFELISELRAIVEEDFLKLTTSCVAFLFKVIDSFPGAIYLINGYLDLLTKFESNVPHIDEVVNMSTTLIHGQTDVSNYSKIGLIYQFLANPSTIKASSRLISALLSEKNIKTIQATYTMVIKWIGDELASLQAAKNNSNFKEQLEIKNASIRLFCLLQSLEHLATIKNSFVVMMLQPSLFTFLTTLPLSDDTFLEGFPMEHHTLMRLLHLHCESHGFFVVNSSWIVAASPSPIHQNLTKNHAESQLKLLHALLLKGNRVTLGKTRKLCDEWLESLFNNLPDYSLPEVVNHRDFKELQVTLWSLLLENPKRIERLQSVLKILEVTASNDEETMISQVKQARTNVQKLNHEDSIRLWKKIPSRSYILSGVSITGWTDTEMTQKKANECRFSTEHFSIIITFLLHKQMPNLLRNENDTWIHETIAYLHSTITGVEKELLMTRWRWALAQTVNYCIENRMRTQFGGPMETFSEFSKEIHRLAKEAISEIPNNKVEEKTMKSQPSVSSTTTLARRPEKSSKDEGNEVKEPRALNASEDWWRVRLLLEFVDLLDKAIYSAHTGASFSPFNVSEISRHFFIQNANACQEWLSRNYIPAMAVAYTAGAYAQVIRFGASALLDFERKQKKEKAGNNRESPNEADSKMNGQTMPGLVLMALQWITKAMVQLGYELPILGLAGWTQRVYTIVPEWLPICADIAAARWESSIAKLRTYLIQKNSDVEAKFAREMMLFCVLRVRLPELVSANHCPPDLSMWDVMSDSTNDAMFPECPPGFEESAFNCCRDLCVFGKVDTVPVYSNTAWKIPEKSLQIEHTLLTTMRRPEVLDIETQLANDAALVLATEGPLRLHTRFAIVQAIARLLATRMQKKGPELQDVHASIIAELDPAFILEKPKSDLGERVALGRQLLLWTERLGGPAYIESHVQMARLCRKTSNHMLTASHLMRAASNPNYARSSFNQIMVARQGAKMLWPTATFEQRAQHFVGLFSLAAKAYEMDLNQRVNGETFSPTSTRSSEVLLQLPNGNTIPVDPFNASAPVTTGGLATAKAAMLLAKWLGNEPDLFGTLPPEAAQLVFMNHLGVLTQEIGSIDWVGALLSMATKCAPTIAKSHEQLAQWALSQASLQSFISDQAFFVSNYSRLLGPEIATPERLEALWKAIFSSNSLAQLQNAVIVALGGTFASAAEILLKQTVYYTNMWGKMLERRRQLMTMGANSLFAFLRHHDRGMRTSIGTVRVCLQILDLLAHHQDIIHSILENGIQSTDVSLWVSVLPQVFARLSHPSRKVRETLIELIQRIGKISPHTVVYQIVVGASKQMLMDAETEDLVETNDEIAQDTHLEEKSLMFECCRRLEESLASFYPEMVSDVRSFVEELQKINLLLEERWVFVLANIDNEMEKRLTHIRAESEKTLKAAHLGEKERIELVQEKTRLITNSVFELLDDLYERTLNRTSTSVNEKSFIDEHKEKIAAAFETSRANRANPEKAWAPFRQLLAALIQKTARRTNSTLQIEDISEKLSKLNGSKVPIPGQEAIDFAEICYLDRLGKTAWVLPTKTRPKKLILIGSNGKENIFLFKGQEDLHLDERIMQLLHICNLMLRGAKELQGDWPLYEALNYSVTPLGARSGLIQWVIGCTPLFQLYRRWQNRQAQTKTLLNRKAGQATLNNNAPLERPTDMFMKKLRASFKENTIAPEVYGDRSKWPKTILRDVLLELMKETPNDLLAKELWMRAGSADTWWRVTSRMARSSAVMSIIGAILGLGDRHLDNLLVNLDSGQMVHIDYNVCFDKGRHLRVPETVPFRLTPNIVHALGPTQIDGMFQQSCQQALDVFRTGKKVLLTVLDAFVYDPLVDWAAAHDHLTTSAAVGSVNVAVALAVYGTDSRAAGARPIARQMFAVRVREFATPWKENKIELTQAIQHLIATINYEVKLDVQSPLEEAHALQKSRNEALQRMKAAIHAHHQIMKNFRQLLRALSACDPRFSAYTKKYRERFADGVVKAHEAMESIPSNFLLAITVLSSVVETINDVYDGLLSLDSAAPIVPAQSSTISPTNFMAPPGFEDTTPGEQQKQQQNLYARSVNRKVEARLDGRIDGNEPMKCFTIQEQVDQWIRSATSLSNLSLMYEGWTAWV